tara:strand:- start:536 stop:637 length:102 start_codon:yes stop_codon:yes gene_type:complete
MPGDAKKQRPCKPEKLLEGEVLTRVLRLKKLFS